MCGHEKLLSSSLFGASLNVTVPAASSPETAYGGAPIRRTQLLFVALGVMRCWYELAIALGVSGVPSEHMIPGRILKVMDEMLTVQSVATYGTTFLPSGLIPTIRSYIAIVI